MNRRFKLGISMNGLQQQETEKSINTYNGIKLNNQKPINHNNYSLIELDFGQSFSHLCRSTAEKGDGRNIKNLDSYGQILIKGFC